MRKDSNLCNKCENRGRKIDAGVSVSILNKETCDLICCNSSLNLLPISSKLKNYAGELIYSPEKIECKVNYKGQYVIIHLFLLMVNGRFYWEDICCV